MGNTNVKKTILTLSTDEKKENYVEKRMNYFENNHSNIIVDYKNNYFYNNYINSSTQYRPFYDCVKDFGVIFDDKKPFLYFVNKINSPSYNIFNFVFDFHAFKEEYFPKNNILSEVELDYKRVCVYMNYLLHGIKRVPIEEFSKEKCAGSAEISGLCHNVLNFLGYDSTVVFGKRNGDYYTFNLIFPNGYGKQALLFDPNNDLVFKRGKHTIKYPFFKLLADVELNKLINGETLEINADSSMFNIEEIPNKYKIVENNYKYSVSEYMCENENTNKSTKKRIRK